MICARRRRGRLLTPPGPAARRAARRRTRETGGMWAHDEATSPDLIHRLRLHARHPEDFTVFVGPGWIDLVERCHTSLVTEYPRYELLAVKEKYGRLSFQAFPRPWSQPVPWTDNEHRRVDDICDGFGDESETVCEACGAPGAMRDARQHTLTL